MFQKGVNFHSHSRNGYSLHTPMRKPKGQLRMRNPETGVKQNQYIIDIKILFNNKSALAEQWDLVM